MFLESLSIKALLSDVTEREQRYRPFSPLLIKALLSDVTEREQRYRPFYSPFTPLLLL